MSKRVLIRHSTGSKASTVEEFPVMGPKELLFGREASCDIRFDQDRDEFVSRRHMKLVVGDPDQLEFTAVDLSARNGTFVNRRRVTGSAKLQPGDVVQLGAGGPEFTFDVAPEDLRVTPRSGIVPVDEFRTETAPSSEVARAESAPPVNPPAINALPVSPAPVSAPLSAALSPPAVPAPPKASTPRPSAPRKKVTKRSSPKKQLAGMAVLVLAAVAAGTYFLASRRTPAWGGIGATARSMIARATDLFRSSGTQAPEEVTRQNAQSLVTVETAWRLVDPATGRPVKQIYIPNRREQSDTGSAPLIPNAGSDLPVFVLLAKNRLQPLLTVADQSSYQAIGGKSRSAGFIVASDHLILTSRSGASPWRAPYDWPSHDAAGIVAVFDQQLKLSKTAVIARRQFPRWRPEDTDFVLESTLDQNSVRVNSLIHGKGLSDSLTVHISARLLDVPASLVKESDETGFAAIRLDTQISMRGVALATEANPKVGDELVMVASADARSAIGKLSAIDPGGRYDLTVGTVQTAGAGAPIFDRQGRVVAVQAESDPLRPDRAFAISIRRALESVGQPSAQRKFNSAFRIAAAELRH